MSSSDEVQPEPTHCPSTSNRLRFCLALMAVFVAIFLPRLSPEVFRPRWSSPTEQGCMVLERDKVIVLDQAARDAGVMVGMKRGGVTTLTADALMYDRSPARELDVQREVAFALLRSCASRLKSPCARKKPSSLMSQQVCDCSAASCTSVDRSARQSMRSASPRA